MLICTSSDIIGGHLYFQRNALTKEAVITNLWGCDYEYDDRAIDTHIKNIRKKLDPSLIATVKGIGYRLNM